MHSEFEMKSSPPLLGTTYQGVLGAVIASVRSNDQAHPITQADVAGQLGVNVSTWSRIERGESAISLEQLVVVASFLKIPLSELFKVVEERVAELNQQGIRVAVSKDALQDNAILPMTTNQLLAMCTVPAGLGTIGLAALTLYKKLQRTRAGK